MAIGRNKTLDRISALLAQAENDGATPAEKESFLAKAQQLAEVAAIDLAVARAHQADKSKVEVPEERKIWVGSRRSPTNKWKVELFIVIARANDCKCLILGNGLGVAPAGFPSDLDVVERLYGSLVLQMVTSADAALQRGENKRMQRVKVTEREEIAWEDRDWGGWDAKGRYYDDYPGDDQAERAEYAEAIANGWEIECWQTGKYRKPYPPPAYRKVPVRDADGNLTFERKEVSTSDGRIWRANFYEGFIARVSSQLREAKRRGRAEHDEGLGEETKAGVAVALRDKKAETDEFHAERSRSVSRSWGGATTSDVVYGAAEAGSAAAATADYGTDNKVESGAAGALPSA